MFAGTVVAPAGYTARLAKVAAGVSNVKEAGMICAAPSVKGRAWYNKSVRSVMGLRNAVSARELAVAEVVMGKKCARSAKAQTW